ncbi:hypothetical protein HAX54_037679, partial [Datura stramonium]|nr:hypothetical protein [Datura stramonium]
GHNALFAAQVHFEVDYSLNFSITISPRETLASSISITKLWIHVDSFEVKDK